MNSVVHSRTEIIFKKLKFVTRGISFLEEKFDADIFWIKCGKTF